MTNHVVLCGLGKVGISTLEILHSLGVEVAVIAREVPSEWATRVNRWAATVVLDDDRDQEALVEADLAQARALIIATDDDLANIETALYACELAPDVPIVLRLYDRQLGDRVRHRLPVRAVLNAGDTAAGAFVASLLGDERVRTIVSGQHGVIVETHDVSETEDGLTCQEVAERLNAVPIGLRGRASDDVSESARNSRVAAGDSIVLARAISSAGDRTPQGDPSVRRYGRQRLRRPTSPLKVLLGLWRASSPAIRWAFGAFVGLIAIGIVVFRLSLGLSWLDALYFTATIVTTVGFGDITLLQAPPFVKLFGIGLMLSGAALLVVVFGIVTDYLLTVRVEQALGLPKTSLKGHTVVAGAGNLGHRIVQDLLRLGEQVVAVDQRSDLRFINPLGDRVTVLHGDATEERVIELAGIGDARAIAAVTDNDVVNLRIAEMAKTLNPSIRTVIRVFSTRIVGRLGTNALGVDVVLNPSLTAAATFAASALAPNVLQAFEWNGRLFMLRKADPEVSREWRERAIRDARSTGRIAVLLRRKPGHDTPQVANPDDVIGQDDELIVLDEYCPQTGRVQACLVVFE